MYILNSNASFGKFQIFGKYLDFETTIKYDKIRFIIRLHSIILTTTRAIEDLTLSRDIA